MLLSILDDVTTDHHELLTPTGAQQLPIVQLNYFNFTCYFIWILKSFHLYLFVIRINASYNLQYLLNEWSTN